MQIPGSWNDRKPQEQFVCRRWQQPPRGLVVEWCSPMHTSESHNLKVNLHGPWCLPSFSREGLRVSGSPVPAQKHKARSHRENVTLTMTKGGSELTHPERCLSNCSWSLPKQSYCFPSNLKDRENWLLPWSSQQLHITPLCCGSCAKTVQKLCVA